MALIEININDNEIDRVESALRQIAGNIYDDSNLTKIQKAKAAIIYILKKTIVKEERNERIRTAYQEGENLDTIFT